MFLKVPFACLGSKAAVVRTTVDTLKKVLTKPLLKVAALSIHAFHIQIVMKIGSQLEEDCHFQFEMIYF